jgi:Zn-dependent proteases
MPSSFRIARILESEIRVHQLWLWGILLSAGLVLVTEGWRAAISDMATLLLGYLFVLLHEFGHALAARRFGIGTPTITIYPFGGVAFMEGFPRSPRAQVVVSIAGPLVNLVFAVPMLAAGLWNGMQADEFTLAWLVDTCVAINLVLAIFNLLPAYPMDGGRILKAWTEVILGDRVAVRVAFVAGQTIGVIFLAASIALVQPMLGLVGLFVLFMSAIETGRHPLWMLGLKPTEAMIRAAAKV